MERMQIFVGPPASGKSRKAREITEGKNAVWLDGRNLKYHFHNPFLFEDVTDETEFIVVDDCNGNINRLALMFFNEKLSVEKMGKDGMFVNRPKIIITTDQVNYKFDTGTSFQRRFEIIQFPTQN